MASIKITKKNISKGTFGKVHKGRAKINGKNKQIAIKEFKEIRLKQLADILDIDVNKFKEEFAKNYELVLKELHQKLPKQKLILTEDGKLILFIEPYFKNGKSKLIPTYEMLKNKETFDQIINYFIFLIDKGYLPTHDCFSNLKNKVIISDIDNLVLQRLIKSNPKKSSILKEIDLFYAQFFKLINDLNYTSKLHYKKDLYTLVKDKITSKIGKDILNIVFDNIPSIEKLNKLNRLLFTD